MLFERLDVFGASPTRHIGRALVIFALMTGLTGLPTSVPAQQAPSTCCDQVRPPFYDAEVEALDLADGAVFMVPSALIDVAGFSSILQGQNLSALLSDPGFRAKIYTQAVLSAIAAEELTQLEPEAAQGFGGDDLLTTVTGTSSHAADAAGIAAEVTSGIDLIAAENAAIRAGKSVSAAQAAEAARFKTSLLGHGSSALGSLALAAKLASDFDDARDRVAFLGEAIRDARIAGALADLEAVLRATPGHDPAMVQGVADAQKRLTRLSESRLRRMASVGAEVFDSNRTTMAGMALGSVVSGGAAMVAREVMELGVSLDEFKVQTLSIAAMHNLAAANLDQVKRLANGGDPMLRGLTPGDIDVTRLGAFDARLAAEANASTYNMLWTDRWDKPLSIAGIGKAIGLSAAEHDTAGANLQERYRTLVKRRAQMQARLWRAATPPRPSSSPEMRNNLYLNTVRVSVPSELVLDESAVDVSDSMGSVGPWFYTDCGISFREVQSNPTVGDGPCRLIVASSGGAGAWSQSLNLPRSKGCVLTEVDVGPRDGTLTVDVTSINPPEPGSTKKSLENMCPWKIVVLVIGGFSIDGHPMEIGMAITSNEAGEGVFDLEGLAQEIAADVKLIP